MTTYDLFLFAGQSNMAGRGTDIMLGGNAEYMAKNDLRKAGLTDELIAEATGYAETDNEEILNARKLFAVAAILVEIERLHALAVAVLLLKINGEQAFGVAAVGQQHDLVAVLQLPAPDDLVAVLHLHTAHPGGDAPLHRYACLLYTSPSPRDA